MPETKTATNVQQFYGEDKYSYILDYERYERAGGNNPELTSSQI